MPFPTKILPLDCHASDELIRYDPVKPVAKSRLKRLFERQFPSVLRVSSAEKPGVGEQHINRDGVGEPQNNRDGVSEFEPSTVCLAKMVQSFIEENNERQSVASKCGRSRCNCFSGSCSGSSDDEFDICSGSGDTIHTSPSREACELLKSLVPCAIISERNLLADTSKIIDKNNGICKRKDDCRKIVTDGLLALGYNASICKSRWDKSPSYPAGEYEYLDVIIDGERLLIDIDFRSEFEIARSTGNYKAVLQVLPQIFVGRPDRLQQIIAIVSEAAKQSLKKKEMHIPPWRKPEYMQAKWLSPYSRITSSSTSIEPDETAEGTETKTASQPCVITTESFSIEVGMIFGEKSSSPPEMDSGDGKFSSSSSASAVEEEKISAAAPEWRPPAIKPRSSERRRNIVTGLASVLREKA